MVCSEEVDFGMGGDNLEVVVFFFEGLYGGMFVKILDVDGFVFIGG